MRCEEIFRRFIHYNEINMKSFVKISLILAGAICINSCDDDSIQPTETYKSYTIKSITLLRAPDKSYITNGIVSDYDNDGTGPDTYCRIETQVIMTGQIVKENTGTTFDNADLTKDLPLYWACNKEINDDVEDYVKIDFVDKDDRQPEFDQLIGSIVIFGDYFRERSTITNGRSSVVVSDTAYYYQNPPRVTTAKFEIQWNK